MTCCDTTKKEYGNKKIYFCTYCGSNLTDTSFKTEIVKIDDRYYLKRSNKKDS